MKKILSISTLLVSVFLFMAIPVTVKADPFVGEIRAVGFNFAPNGWALCNGQILPISQNTALFSLLGTQYGGNGSSTFALPNLQGKVPIGNGQGPGLSDRVQGETGGSETITLTEQQMPAHIHTAATSGNALGTITAIESKGTTSDPTDAMPAEPMLGPNEVKSYIKPAGPIDITNAAQLTANQMNPMAQNTIGISMENAKTGVTGQGQPIDIEQPYLTVHYIISLHGVFPSRQ